LLLLLLQLLHLHLKKLLLPKNVLLGRCVRLACGTAKVRKKEKRRKRE
jgi:hypothetical protein